MGKKMDVVGDVYGQLTIIGEADSYLSPKGEEIRRVSYVCSCGVKGEARLGDIRKGHTKSCGHLQKGPPTKHGKSRSKLYKVYINMRARCNNSKDQSYVNYGARGIKVCEEWDNNFESFDEWSMTKGYAEGLSIERVDVNGDYTPDNCTWVTALQQVLNRRMLKNNTSGITGVRYSAGQGVWIASWSVEGKQKAKYFNVNKFGDAAQQMAISKRLEMEQKLGITNNSRGGNSVST